MPGGSICSSLSYISVRDGGLGRGEASTRSIKLSGSQRSCTGRLSAAPRASSSQHPISLPPRLISSTPRLKFPMPSVCYCCCCRRCCSSAAPGPGAMSKHGEMLRFRPRARVWRVRNSRAVSGDKKKKKRSHREFHERRGAKKIINHCCCFCSLSHSACHPSPFFSHDYIHNTVVCSLSL